MKWKKEENKFLREVEGTMSVNEIYDYFKGGFTKTQIKNKLKNGNIGYRKLTSKELSKVASITQIKNWGKGSRKRRTKLNRQFFKKWSNDMAYVLGLWFADGYISKQNKGYYFGITLHRKDKYLLDQIIKTMDSEHKVYDRKKEKCSDIRFSCKEFYNDIISLGGQERKSWECYFPEVPTEHLKDFVRGYFDGDGHVSKIKPQVKIVGTVNFLKVLNSVLEKEGIEGGYLKLAHPNKENSNLYALRIGRYKEAIKFSDYIYNSESSLFLKRKKDIFNKHKERDY